MKYTAKGKKGFQVQQENISPEDLSRVVTQVRDALGGAHTVLVQLLQRFPIRDGQFSVSPASPS